jgi:acyl carrier protein
MHPSTHRVVARRRQAVGDVKQLLIERLGLDLEPDEVAEDSPLFGYGLGLDSIDALTLIVAIEDHFGVRVPDGDVHVFRSVNTVADFVLSTVSATDADEQPAS